MSGPLSGLKVLELAGIGPAPYACMLLADAGADILRLERAAPATNPPRGGQWDILNRSRRSVAVDLKHPEGRDLTLELVEQSDVLIEGFRPGVTERLGLGPDACMARNPKLIYGRMTGWGQEGPWADRAGHDIDYIALSGALWSIGRAGEIPVPPLNLVGDFGGGGMMLAFGVMAALFEAGRSGKGQVVDAAMIDGSASMLAQVFAFHSFGWWLEERAVNILDTGAHFYEVYATADDKFFALGPIEGKFYAELLKGLGLEGEDLPGQMDRAHWPAMKERFKAIIKTKTRDEWAAIFDGTDACAAPVLSPWEAKDHPHNKERDTFIEVDGLLQPGVAPRFSRTKSEVSCGPPDPGQDTDEALADWGVSEDRVDALRKSGAIG